MERIDPPCERFTYGTCEMCKERIILHDERFGKNPDTFYMYFDKREYVFCGESCYKRYMDEIFVADD